MFLEMFRSGGKGVNPESDRRSCPRRSMAAPIAARFPWGVVNGTTVNLSYSGMLVQSQESMPVLGEVCEMALDLANGLVHARARVARIEPERRRFAVEVTHIGRGSYLPLAEILAELGCGGRMPKLGGL